MNRRVIGGVVAVLACVLTACGGNSSESTLIGGGVDGSGTGPEVAITEPSGDNTTEIVVDQGPVSGFSAAVANLAYVTVTVCEPGSTTRCATVDHVLLDTGSIGLRVLRSAVASLALPAVSVAAGALAECYPFVIGAVWGPVARADVRIAGSTAAALPVHLIDDQSPAAYTAPAECEAAANGGLMQTTGSLQAKGILGIGMLSYDCGLSCQTGNYGAGVTLYYACEAGSGRCTASAVAPENQVQHPVAALAEDNNGTLIVLPAVPAAGASKVRGRLVLGIGTRANNQLKPETRVLRVDPDPAHDAYLYLTTRMDGSSFPNSYVDSGSNGLFFDDPAGIATCASGSPGEGQWYCPSTLQSRQAEILAFDGTSATANFGIGNANALFSTANVAFGNLGGSVGSSNPGAFVWGLPFFFGRTVYTSIWGQALAQSGPWYAF
jgi:hypothetical protein